MATPHELRAYFELADKLIAGATRDDLADAARILALNVAHYQQRYGDLPLENFTDMLRAEAIDPATPELLSTGMQQLVGVLGIVMDLDLDENHGATDVH